MAKFLRIFIVLALIGGCAYAGYRYPAGCEKFLSDEFRDVSAIGVATVKGAQTKDWSGEGKAFRDLAHDSIYDATHLSSIVPDAKNTSSEASAEAQPNPDVDVSPTKISYGNVSWVKLPNEFPPPAWKAPTKFPEHPDWTWSVNHNYYDNVQVVGMEKDSVVIVYRGGGQRIAVADLDRGTQQALGYVVPPYDANTAPKLNGWVTGEYDEAIGQARLRGKRVLLYFTGQGWSAPSDEMEKKIVATPEFQGFGDSGYVMVRAQMPASDTTDPILIKNQQLAKKFDVRAVPTLISIDLDDRERARVTGVPPDLNTLIQFITHAEAIPRE